MQEKLFDLIISRFAKRPDAIEDIMEVLNLSKDPIYRRVRNETPLTPDELVTLSKHYRISLDSLVMADDHTVICSFNAFERKVTDFVEYLTHYVADMEKIKRLPQVEMFYASAEIPVFSYMYFPELICLKLYVWGRTTWNLEYLKNTPFDFSMLTPPLEKLCQEILKIYNSLNSTELCSINIVDNTIAQIEYHVYSGGFRNEQDAVLLFDKMLLWAEHMKAMATVGKKFMPGGRPIESSADLKIYHNEMVYTSNTIMIKSAVGNAIYTAVANPNFIKSTDLRFTNYMGDWFQNVLSKSNPIYMTAEKSRDWYFKALSKKIENARNRVLRHIEEG